jgi:hypothetical protein
MEARAKALYLNNNKQWTNFKRVNKKRKNKVKTDKRRKIKTNPKREIQ